jgi:hypothetical protein
LFFPLQTEYQIKYISQNFEVIGLHTDHPDLNDNVVKKHIIILCRLIYTHEKFEDTKGVTRRGNSNKNRHYNGQYKKGQKNKLRSTKHYTEN